MVPSAWGTVDKKDDPYVWQNLTPPNQHNTDCELPGTATIRRMLCHYVEDRAWWTNTGRFMAYGFR